MSNQPDSPGYISKVEEAIRVSGFPPELFSTSQELANQNGSETSCVVHLARNSKGEIGAMFLPEALFFRGVVAQIGAVTFLIEQGLASEWGLL